MLINIKLSLDRLGTKIQQDKEYFMQIDPEKVQADPQEKIKLDKFVCEWLKYAGFRYEGFSDSEKRLTGFCSWLQKGACCLTNIAMYFLLTLKQVE